MRVNNNQWIENTGTVPDGVGPDTVIEVEYRDGYVAEWAVDWWLKTDDPILWEISNSRRDVIRWRLA